MHVDDVIAAETMHESGVHSLVTVSRFEVSHHLRVLGQNIDEIEQFLPKSDGLSH